MRVLFLTWEFPPLIAGGLGVACHGMVKALLKTGIEIDMVLPTEKSVYFPLRKPSDADYLPVAESFPSSGQAAPWQDAASTGERLRLLGLAAQPETYQGIKTQRLYEGVQPSWSRGGQTEKAMRLLSRQAAQGRAIFQKVERFAAHTVADYLQGNQCDLIHAHDWLTFPAGLLAREICGRSLVAHIHATEFDRAGGPGDESIHRLEYMGLKYADLAIAVSRYTAGMVSRNYLVSPEHIRVVHNAHSTQTSGGKRRRLFTDPLIVFLGRITLQKGPDYFLEVAQKVLRRHPKVHFVMAGDGDMRRQMIHKAAFLRLKHHFLFTTFLDKQQVDRLLEAADIFIMPSISEPFGIVPLEAMAHKVAVIISKQSGVAEVVENAHKIDFWDVDQTVARVCSLIEDPGLRKRMGVAGYREVCAMSWDKPAVKINHAYQQLLNAPGPAMTHSAAAA